MYIAHVQEFQNDRYLNLDQKLIVIVGIYYNLLV